MFKTFDVILHAKIDFCDRSSFVGDNLTTLTFDALFDRTGVVLDIAHFTRYVDAL